MLLEQATRDISLLSSRSGSDLLLYFLCGLHPPFSINDHLERRTHFQIAASDFWRAIPNPNNSNDCSVRTVETREGKPELII